MFNPFVVPFMVGVIVLFTVVIIKYLRWLMAFSIDDRKKIARSIFTKNSLAAIKEVFKESLLHVSIFKHNFWLGYMHSALAFGWFLLIVVGAVEVAVILGSGSPLYVHIFYKFFYPQAHESMLGIAMTTIMDAILLYVLSGVAFAWFKRLKKRGMGMKKRTNHSFGDRMALTSLWFIFPARLLAESVTSAVHDSGGFLTGGVGRLLSKVPNIESFELSSWWFYSIVLCLFFVSMPFSRYMHIFTEIPHIFLKKWGIKPTKENFSKSDNFQIHSCSRCGICIDPCQIQLELGIDTMQAVYYLRNRREDRLNMDSVDNCFMCGRCETKCPVNIDINTLRLNSRHKYHGGDASDRYLYLNANAESSCMNNRGEILRSESGELSSTKPEVGYFAGCMTMLQPATIASMKKIFKHAGCDVWFADSDGGVCCGRPLMLSGEIEAARKLIDFNLKLIKTSGIKKLVTSCPICAKVFNEEYGIKELGVEVLHHTQYIDQLLVEDKIRVEMSAEAYTYHDSCELGRGMGVYDEPRRVITQIGQLVEASKNRENALCCGHSLANTRLSGEDKRVVGTSVLKHYKSTGATTIVTACPQCKAAFHVNREGMKAVDISEIVAQQLIVVH